jgi:hypothetical protein
MNKYESAKSAVGNAVNWKLKNIGRAVEMCYFGSENGYSIDELFHS